MTTLPVSTLEGVPVNDNGEEADLELRPEGNNVVCLSPYPFRRDPLEFSILARRVPRRVYVDDLDFQNTLARAQFFAMHFSVHARGAGNRSYAASL